MFNRELSIFSLLLNSGSPLKMAFTAQSPRPRGALLVKDYIFASKSDTCKTVEMFFRIKLHDTRLPRISGHE